MPRRCVPKKDVALRRYGWGSREQALSPPSPNGATQPHSCGYPTVSVGRAPGELKHLTYPEEQKVLP
jgi:hypothetical protein